MGVNGTPGDTLGPILRSLDDLDHFGQNRFLAAMWPILEKSTLAQEVGMGQHGGGAMGMPP